jgi:hypothetical protein
MKASNEIRALLGLDDLLELQGKPKQMLGSGSSYEVKRPTLS